VATSLVGQKLGSFTRVATAVRGAVEEALTRILTPKRRCAAHGLYRQMGGQRNRQTGRRADRQTDRRTDGQALAGPLEVPRKSSGVLSHAAALALNPKRTRHASGPFCVVGCGQTDRQRTKVRGACHRLVFGSRQRCPPSKPPVVCCYTCRAACCVLLHVLRCAPCLLCSVDILREVHAAKAKGKPYTIVFVGVNGVGKSTNLAKVAYWLLQNGVSVRVNVRMSGCQGKSTNLRRMSGQQLCCPTVNQTWVDGLQRFLVNHSFIVELKSTGYTWSYFGMQNRAPALSGQPFIDCVLAFLAFVSAVPETLNPKPKCCAHGVAQASGQASNGNKPKP
jgi:hypothetical protein